MSLRHACDRLAASCAVLPGPVVLVTALTMAIVVPSAFAASPGAGDRPIAETAELLPLSDIAALDLDPLNKAALAVEDAEDEALGLPTRFAVPTATSLTPETDGTWETHPDDPRFLIWRLQVRQPGALSLNFGFARFRLPKGARLAIHDPEFKGDPRFFTARDNAAHGELWTPVVLGDAAVLELVLPAESRLDYELELAQIGGGYRFFGATESDGLGGDKSGSCNNDVICPEGDDWRDEIPSVGVYTRNGSWMCTGVMVNNTAADETPYFLTANHCGINGGNDQTVVVYWNFESPVCGQQGGGSLDDFNSGTIFRAASSASDFCLVEMEEMPLEHFGVTYSGWNRGDEDQPLAVAIHHPSTDEKSISFEDDPTTTTSYLQSSSPGNGTHIRVEDWDDGTTEPGSSGSPLYDPNHRIVGQLHGGYAACGNNTADWYGRVSVSWNGGGSASSRLRDWLDPLGTEPLTVDTYNPLASGLRVSPSDGLYAEGDQGGPFTPSSVEFTLENRSDIMLAYSVTVDVPWLTVTGGSGSVPAGETATVTVGLNPGANALPEGVHDGVITFTNLTDGDGDTVRPARVRVGEPSVVYGFPLDTDPGWPRSGLWAFGQPQGQGGEYGDPDPTVGYTGPNVLGYNLGGDYENNLPERHLTLGPLDCSQLSATSLRFWRWLNVEQPTYDHATVSVSNDGTTWTTVWTNGAEITDTAWMQVDYNIAAHADGQGEVWIRWTMGTTDGSWQYSGWNIDDIEILAYQSGPTPAPPAASQALLFQNAPNPFNPRTTIRFELGRAEPVRLRVYDLQGRLVRTLLDGSLAAGPYSVAWNGDDDGGRRVGSGTYLYRLETGGTVQERKMVLLK